VNGKKGVFIVSGFNISFQWRTTLVQENGAPYFFPDKFTQFFRKKYSVSGVYRWRVLKNQPGEKEHIYIGEAEQLPRRIQRVRTPSKAAKDTDTNKRLHAIFQKFLSEGRKIAFDLGDVEPFEINGVRFGRDTMHDPFKRLAVENILLALAQKSGEYEVLNVFVDRVADAVAKVSKLPPHELKKLLELFAKKGEGL
jgi:hypothetical protein